MLIQSVLTDAFIAVSFISIPLCIFYLLRRRPEQPFQSVYYLFALCFLAVGATQILSLAQMWSPLEHWQSIAKAMAALLAMAAAFRLWWVLPRIVKTPTPQQLEAINRRLEESVHQRTRSLERTVHQLEMEIRLRQRYESELEEAKKLAEKSAQYKSEFLANMSHELRTPLGLVLGFAEELTNRQPQEDSSNQELCSVIRRNGDVLKKVINDILDLSKIEAGRMEFDLRPLRLEILLDDVETMFNLKCQEKGIRLFVERDKGLPDVICSDMLRLKQILINLASNALKFTTHGHILIRAAVKGRRITFDVIDTGQGIDSREHELIFEAFEQSQSNRHRQAGGTGLGLSLSRALARGLKGDLTLVESTPGRGSWFRVEVMDQSGRKTISQADSFPLEKCSQAPDLRARRILVVDDVADNLKLMEIILKATRAQVTCVGSGLHALSVARSQVFDLVLMDLQMPDLDGYQTLAELRQTIGYENEVWAISADAMVEDIKKALLAGFSEHVAKPIDRAEFYARLRRFEKPVPRVSAAQRVDRPVSDVHLNAVQS